VFEVLVVWLVVVLVSPSSCWNVLSIAFSSPLAHNLICGGFDFIWVSDDVILKNEMVYVDIVRVSIEYWSKS